MQCWVLQKKIKRYTSNGKVGELMVRSIVFKVVIQVVRIITIERIGNSDL